MHEYGANHSRTRQRAAAARGRPQRPARPARGFGALAFRHVPDGRHLQRPDGRGAVRRPRRPRAAGDAARNRRHRRLPPTTANPARTPRPRGCRAPRQIAARQGPPPHGSVDGQPRSATATSSAPCPSCRSRWRWRPATRPPATIRPSIRSRCSPRTAQRRAASASIAGQIYGAKVESDMSLKTVDFPIETAAFDEKSGLSADEVEKVVRETGGHPDRRRRPGGRASLRRSAAIRRLAGDAGAHRLLRRQDRPGERLGRTARRRRRTGRASTPRTSFPSPTTATSTRRWRRCRLRSATTPPAWPRRSPSC